MNVEEVQRRLWEQSKIHKQHRKSDLPLFPVNPYEKRIRNLMDLMHQPDWLQESCERVLVRSRNKASGVDRVTVQKFSNGLEGKLAKLRLELKCGTYQPQPVRQVMIPKSNGKMRALGIPCLRDKIVQEAMRMALEPVFEVEFHNNSYGFRPNRNTHQAVFRCQQLMRSKFSWVIEGDVKACFDEISHKAILKALRQKIMDNKFLDLIHLMLKAGVDVDGVVQPTEKGVPQGGVMSPLLANVVLNKLDWFLHNKGKYGKAHRIVNRHREPNVRFTRYADDWCVFVTRASKRYAEELRKQIQIFLLNECGLELSVEKTHVTNVRDGYDFLGFCLSYGIGQSGRTVPKIKVGQKAKQNFLKRVKAAMRYRPHQESIAVRIQRGSAVVRGWAEYFRIAHDFTSIAGTLDHRVFWIAVKTICHKFDITTGKAMKKYYRSNTIQVDEMCQLRKLSETSMKMDYRGPKPYMPGSYDPEIDQDMEVNITRFHEGYRRGSRDIKWQTLQRDNYCCCNCGKAVNDHTSQVHHIIPVKRFASFALANDPDNLQTLCQMCHREKHCA